jgi:hypothetical protein
MSIKFPNPVLLAFAACGILLSACQFVNPVLPPATPTGPGATKVPATSAPPAQATTTPMPATTVPASSTAPAAAATATLVPADADAPAAGVCAEATGEWATVQIAADVPSPRCLKITRGQRLKVMNGTQAVVQIRLGEFALELQPGVEGTLEKPIGDYLIPGVHQLQAAPYTGPELWLTDPSSAGGA